MAILGILEEHEVHGYELNKRMAELAGGQGGISFGSLYPALNRLERAGTVRAVDQKHRLTSSFSGPMTGAITGELAALRQKRKQAETTGARRTDKRNRKVYGLTDKGRARLRELLLTTEPTDSRSFSLQVAFCRQITPIERLTLFERRRAHLADARGALLGRTETDPYLRSLREHDIQILDSDLGWVDALIAITRDELTTPPTEPVPATGGTSRP